MYFSALFALVTTPVLGFNAYSIPLASGFIKVP